MIDFTPLDQLLSIPLSLAIIVIQLVTNMRLSDLIKRLDKNERLLFDHLLKPKEKTE